MIGAISAVNVGRDCPAPARPADAHSAKKRKTAATFAITSARRVLVEPHVQPANPAGIRAGLSNGREILLVRREIDPLRGIVGGDPLLLQLAALRDDVGEVG